MEISITLKKKRPKIVYNNRRVAELWAEKEQDHARNTDYSLYYRNDTLYSFGAHYPVASFVRMEGKDECVFLNCIDSKSQTTRQHSYAAFHAIRNHNIWSDDHMELLSGYKVFRVHLSKYRKPYHHHLQSILKDYRDDIDILALKVVRARENWSKRWKLNAAETKMAESRRFSEHFGLDFDSTPTSVPKDSLGCARLALIIEDPGNMQYMDRYESEYYNN
jgi:hypothetical protein